MAQRMRSWRRAAVTALVAGAGVLAVREPARACDVCAIYTATEMRESRVGLLVGVAEQYTDFGTLQDGGTTVSNPFDQYMTSSITQLLLGYNLTPRIGVQLNLPIIARNFRRPVDGRAETDSESGFGDMALTGNLLAYHHVSEESLFRFTVLGGVKFPTGNPDRLQEELAEEDEPTSAGLGTAIPQHGGVGDESGIHGHDVALGSGSYDGIVGAALYWSWRRLFLQAGTQYAIRTTGSFDYRYANDLTWSVGPGGYPFLTHAASLGVQLAFTGETKGNDEQNGVKLDDTALTALYLSPGLSFTWGTSLGTNLAVDVPVRQQNTGLQIVADWRLRGGVTWRF